MNAIDPTELNTLLDSENIQGSDRQNIVTLITTLAQKMLRENPPPAKLQRDAHPRQIGLVKATFTINKNIPEALRKGIFKKEKTYEAWVRFSNQNAPPKHDFEKDIRGMALKILEVDGLPTGATQDFILVSTDVFVARDLAQFTALVVATAAGKFRTILHFLTHPCALFNLLGANKRFGSILDARFWSVSPYRFDDRVVKYSVIPRRNGPTPLPSDAKSNPFYLTDELARKLSIDDYHFDFAVQFQKDPSAMPTEDLLKRWKEEDSPFVTLATLTIPQQPFHLLSQQSMGDQLKFSPWNCLDVHEPVGRMNRARKIIYPVLSEFRSTNSVAPM